VASDKVATRVLEPGPPGRGKHGRTAQGATTPAGCPWDRDDGRGQIERGGARAEVAVGFAEVVPVAALDQFAAGRPRLVDVGERTLVAQPGTDVGRPGAGTFGVGRPGLDGRGQEEVSGRHFGGLQRPADLQRERRARAVAPQSDRDLDAIEDLPAQPVGEAVEADQLVVGPGEIVAGQLHRIRRHPCRGQRPGHGLEVERVPPS
jgi:hypothetical protein